MNRLALRATIVGSLIAILVAFVAMLPPPPHLQGQDGPPRDGGRGPGRFGGPPGFGGPMGPGGPPQSNLMVAMIPEVQTELNLNDVQKRTLSDLQVEVGDAMRSSFEGINFQELSSLSEEDRRKRFDEVRIKSEAALKQIDAKFEKSLDAKQIERLNQLVLQRDVLGALTKSETAEKLKLTEKQIASIREIAAQGPPQFGPPLQNSRQKSQDDALAVLNDEQKTRWADLTGKKFTFPEGGPFGGPGGRGPGGPAQERKLVAQFDKDGDGRLNRAERDEARKLVKSSGGRGGGLFGGPPFGGPPGGPGGGPPNGGGPGGPRGGPGFGRENEPAKPGAKVSPSDVQPAGDAPLYDANVLRTVFIQFEDSDWEAELADFNNTDVEVPATVTVDGIKYPNVGVHFRGMSSFMMVQAGSKRSLNLSFDFVDEKQNLLGYRTVNLLNSHEDPTFLHTILYSHVARKHIPAPKANFAKVVINGESWGVYVNAQQFNKDFLTENYPSSKGTRWKVSGSPGGRGGLEYSGDNVDDYKARFSIKSKDSDKAWKALIRLCKSLNETPPDQLEEALAPMLDIDGVLWFLALDNALVNGDGYWTRASDYSIYLDEKGIFHILPHDMNEAFQPAMGPPGFGRPPGGGMFGGLFGGGGGPDGRGPEGRPQGEGRRDDRPRDGGPEGRPPRDGGPDDRRPLDDRSGNRVPENRPPGGGGGGPRGGGIDLDPLVGLNEHNKPLRSKLLAVPKLRKRYLECVRAIADDLDWKSLGPVVQQYEKLISKEIEADTKKLSSYAAFQQTVSGTPAATPERGRPHMSIQHFAEQRRQYLLNHPEIKALQPAQSTK